MKTKLLIAFCLLVSTTFAQTKTETVKNESNSVTLTENDKTYELSASYNADLDKKIYDYMDDQISDGGVKFRNTRVDAQMTLDNKMSFYAKNSPGKLVLKLDKRKNSADIYKRFKSMCEGIRDIIQKK
ncbi:hypothetical protein HK413_04860 [Mucilaginibacter sp. S1162]|uniref:Uncharacterized protein n=1 Tax=Mucilaginibacter humi TaxID=2732510 RepID=A0ABX1W0C0_9SPHI|nr:hypothetical protein [Mucilaginibacter humi]NNU33643.1 hypothetical protein [Mucilaginibacter humi]